MIQDLHLHCQNLGSAPAIRSGERLINYQQLGTKIHQLARTLTPLPATVPLVCPVLDPLDSWLLYLAGHLSGKALVFIDPAYTLDDIKDFLGLKRWVWSLDGLKNLPESCSDRSAIEGTICLLTSGSSQKPKGVIHSFASLTAAAQASNKFYGLRQGDSWLLSLGLHHIAGIMIALRTFLAGGVLHIPPKGSRLSQLLKTETFDFLSLVPTQLQDLLLEPAVFSQLKGARAIVMGGAACPLPLTQKALHLKLPLSLSYGSTESGAQVAATRPGEIPRNPFHVGQVIPGRDVKINQDGRICIGPAGCFVSYWGAAPVSGYFVSQDLGYIEQGELFVKGRCDRVFQSGGENISPDEIERLCQDFVEGATCVVVPGNHRRLGFVPNLIIIARTQPNVERLLTMMTDALPKFKRPRSIYWDSSVPLEGKIKYKTYHKQETLESLPLLWDYYG